MTPAAPGAASGAVPGATSSSATGRPLRADALRNRAKVLAAAEAVFAARGTSASTEEVAREAGVGIGTVFRHFPTKESLLEAVLAALLERLADDARGLLAADDPGAAFFGFFTRVVGQAAAERAVAEAVAEAGLDGAGGRARPALRSAVGALLARAQEAGAVRADVGPAQVMALLAGLSYAAARVGAGEDVLAIAFDGLLPPARREGPAPRVPAPGGPVRR
ncbi:TetR/AcrR family transcriptional regulator [Actinomadura sp. NEAU-AAG7]|uniref:TetR/AcrR family transcriptional regulator n=1 Tax=Actinomadura sp. NEAU-AAG7 TaxID=2839640 RepID=UPI001BE444FC|nr:TetR family transcriptional regulator [Actinomadura sp. NEAU-AAG7]MBT2213111.1 TetR/AcrR family transcriptional regulator [Actinomadura sp. NEAU-AAG7]